MANRLESLKQARGLSLSGNYPEAHRIIDKLLVNNADDLDALRLKANLIDLEYASDKNEPLPPSKDYYEKILAIDQDNTLALIDLGDYWSNAGDPGKALSYYDSAINLLEHDKYCESKVDELDEARQGKSEVLTQLAKML